jgi:preprotein translocase subunit SecG
MREPSDTKLTGATRIAVIGILSAFAIAHLIGALLLQRSSPANADVSFQAAQHQD